MTRERIVGFMLGISVGTAVGFYLRPSERDRRDLRRARTPEGATNLRKARDPLTAVRPSSQRWPEQAHRWSGEPAQRSGTNKQ
ncbi:MAG: hypothetical protein LAP38_23725 [Acidobacteriia bacterium]|nr:hypothetical protein [Terriglobia bacterium]